MSIGIKSLAAEDFLLSVSLAFLPLPESDSSHRSLCTAESFLSRSAANNEHRQEQEKGIQVNDQKYTSDMIRVSEEKKNLTAVCAIEREGVCDTLTAATTFMGGKDGRSSTARLSQMLLTSIYFLHHKLGLILLTADTVTT